VDGHAKYDTLVKISHSRNSNNAKKSVIWKDVFVAALKPTDKERDLYEDQGFGIRIRLSGTLTWIFKYVFSGNRKAITLGTYRKGNSKQVQVPLAEARKRRATAEELLSQGIDPVTRLHEINPASRPVKAAPAESTAESAPATYTVNDLIRDYLEQWSRAKKVARSVSEDERLLNKYISHSWGRLPDGSIGKTAGWGARAVTSIKRTDAVDLIRELAELSRGEARNVTRLCLGMWNFAIHVNEKAENNPFARIPKKVPKARVPGRKRYLSDTETRLLWRALTASSNSPQICRACKLILLLSQRPGEVIAMRYEHISGDWWTIPWEETKNGRNPNIKEENKFDHRVYLPPLAKRIIGKGTGYVFTFRGKPIFGEKAISHFVAKEIKAKDGTVLKEKYFGLPNWRPHDLRRTSSTGMADLGATQEHINAIQGHIIPGIAGIYVQTRYDKQKVTWLTRWDEHISALIADEPPAQLETREADRVLSDEELRIVWQGLSSRSPAAAATVGALKLCLITGQAPGKCAALHANQIVTDSGKWWQVGRNKIRLSSLALEVIGPAPSGFVFATQGDHVKIGTLSHLVLKARFFGLEKWSPEDLKWTMAARLSGLGAPADVVQSVANEAPGNEWEIKHYLELWDSTLAGIIA
jgi:integrase